MKTACTECRRPIDTARDSFATRLVDDTSIYCSGVCASADAERRG